IINSTSPVSVTAGVSSTSLCAGNSLSLTGTATNATSWSWSGPDGFNSTIQSPVISNVTTAMAGVYTLSAINGCGTTAANSSAVIINTTSPVSVTAGVSSTSLCAGNSLTLTGTATNATSWSWSGPDGFNSTIQSPVISNVTTAMAGVYTLSAINGCGTTAATSSAVIINSTSPVSVTAGVSSTSLCAGNSLSLTGTATNATSWSWSGPDGFNSTIQSPVISSVTTAMAGVYTLSAINGCGTTAANSSAVIINSTSPVSVTAGVSSTSLCAGNSLTLTGTATNATSWSWSGPDGFNSTIQSPVISSVTTAMAGVYTLSAINGCGTNTANSSSITVTIVVADAGPDVLFGGTPVQIGSVQSSGDSYSWSPGAGLSDATISRPLATVSSTTTYTLTLSAGSCNATDAVVVNFGNVYTISGSVNYQNRTAPYSLYNASYETKIYLYNFGGTLPIDSTLLKPDGTYVTSYVPAGDYSLCAKTKRGWNGVNATDALVIQKYMVGALSLSWIYKQAAYTRNYGTGPNSTDALIINKRWTKKINSFQNGDWVFSAMDPGLDSAWLNNCSLNNVLQRNLNFKRTITNSNITVNIGALCVGDVNGSRYAAQLKTSIQPTVRGEVQLGSGSIIEIPVYLNTSAELGAISLIFSEPQRYGIIESVSLSGRELNSEEDDFSYNISEGQVYFGWNSLTPWVINPEEPFLTLKVRTNNNFSDGDEFLATGEISEMEFAGVDGEALSGISLEAPLVRYDNNLVELSLARCLPNPVTSNASFSYFLPGKGAIKLALFNMLGECVKTIVNEVQNAGNHTITSDLSDLSNGLYSYKILFDDGSSVRVINRTLIISK
ncbi:MAG: T9SS type A sorting domain-containing protein, partial [Bacteroidota bacterium]